jgi:signal transduction histidine kinase
MKANYERDMFNKTAMENSIADDCFGGDTTKQRKFTSEDVHFLQSVANVLAAAIERRQLEQELLDISGREQQRIGQDLHDGICQELTGLHFKAGLIARELPENLGARGKIGEITQSLRTTIEHARMLARGLSPVQLESNGLMWALEELASTTEQLFKIRCRFDCGEPVLIQDNAIATHLYRIAQEAIHNAIKHGHATNVSITLEIRQ